MNLIANASRVCAAMGALCLTARPVLAQSPSGVDAAVRKAISRLDLQTEIPGDPQPSWLDINLPAIDFSTGLLWAIITIGVALALYSVRDDLPRLIFGQSKRWADGAGEEIGPGRGTVPQHAAITADELASQGYYVEAMHVLLLRALAELRDRLRTDFPASLTSREILRRAKLPEANKAPLRDVITRVELSYFGAYPAEARDYAACRESFDRFMNVIGAQQAEAGRA